MSSGGSNTIHKSDHPSFARKHNGVKLESMDHENHKKKISELIKQQ
jgi:hypothetical protein